MKGHKGHHHEHKGVKHHGVHHHHPRAAHAKGGKAESPHVGHKDNDAAEAPHDVYEGANSNVVKEARQRKHGGKAKHHVEMHGHKGHHRADRAPRKSGGRTGSNMNPLSSAHHGTAPKGRHGLEMN